MQNAKAAGDFTCRLFNPHPSTNANAQNAV